MIPMRALSCFTLLALVSSACAGTPAATIPADAQLVVTLKDYSVTPSVPNVKAGQVKIAIKNDGSMEHEFELIKTDLAADKLPIDGGTAKAKEDGLVKQVKSIAVGRVTTVVADLQAGSYVLICNVTGHYQLGMRAALRVD